MFWLEKIAKYYVDEISQNWKIGQIKITLPNGKVFEIGKNGGEIADLRFNSYKALWRIFNSGDIGFFEAYRNDEWASNDLTLLLTLLSKNLDGLEKSVFRPTIFSRINDFLHSLNHNSKKGSRRNILAHYDLGNDFYSQWLDETMTYSAAVFQNHDDLDTAQNRKYEKLCEAIEIRPKMKILEIGCGWGGFAEYAAKNYDVEIDCVTISNQQFEYAQDRIIRAGLDDKVKIKLCDYRDLNGQYDAIVSIEMFEAVGMEYWRQYFDKLNECLKPGGKVGLQIITIHDDLFENYSTRADFIQKYVFPGGMLPSVGKLKEVSTQHGFAFDLQRVFGQDYATTLRIWAQKFDAAWKKGNIKGFDDGFRKLWDFYLAYCIAGFDSQRTNVVHLSLRKAEA